MRNNKNILPLTTLVLLFALVLAYTLFNMHNQGFDFINVFTAYSNDNGELFRPSDNLLEYGKYSLDGTTPYTDRIPGISIIYIPLKLLFSTETAFTLLTLIPLLIHLGIILFVYLKFSKIINRLYAFLLTACIIFLTPFSSFAITKPESYSIVFTAIGFLVLFDFFKINEKKKFIISGVFFMLVATFRGYLLPSVFALTLLLFIYYAYTRNTKTAALQSILFILPLLLYLGIWSTRNYIAKSALIILQTNERGYHNPYKPSTQETKKTLNLMGFETVEFYPGSPVYYFLGKTEQAPKGIYRSANEFGVSKESLDSLRNLSIVSYETKSPAIENKLIEYNKELREKIKVETNIVKLYLLIPVKNFTRGFFHNFTSGWGLPAWNNANIIEKAYRLFIYALFHFSFLLTVVFSVMALVKKQKVLIALSWLIWTSSMFFTYMYLLNNIEFKYFLSLFPLAPIVGGLLFERSLLKKSKSLKTM